jgi:hypothetical protein
MDQSHVISGFLDWLSAEGIVLGRWQKLRVWGEDRLIPVHDGPSALLHRYFEIDPVAEENELQAVLEYARSLNTEKP